MTKKPGCYTPLLGFLSNTINCNDLFPNLFIFFKEKNLQYTWLVDQFERIQVDMISVGGLSMDFLVPPREPHTSSGVAHTEAL